MVGSSTRYADSAAAPLLLGAAIAAVAGFRGQRAATRHAATKPASKARRLASATEGPLLRLGTRGSPLALAQAQEAKRRLAEAYPELAADNAIEIRVLSTVGDQRLDIALSQIGGKGLFTKELDAALVAGEVDFCVHSTKDVPTKLIDGTTLVAMFPREDTRDAFISRDPNVKSIADLPLGSVVGSASLRRASQIYSKRPDIKCVNFRGNVQTRLRKLEAGLVDATLLAYAGLKRMSMEQHATSLLEWDEMLPAIAQGAISLQCRSDDASTVRYLKPLNHEPTMQAVTCERAFLATLDGNCRTPIAGQALVQGGELNFQGLVLSPDGRQQFAVQRRGPAAEAAALGKDAGLEIRNRAGEKFFEEMEAAVNAAAAANTKPTGKD